MCATIRELPELDTSELELLLAEHGYIAIFWHIEDVRQVRPNLSDEQCFKVLQRCDAEHDASIGLDWDQIRLVAEELFPETESVS